MGLALDGGGAALPERVTGVALVDRMCELAAREG